MVRDAQRAGVLYALLAFAIFAVHDVFIKALGGTYSAIQILFFSVLFSFPIVTLILLKDRTEQNLIPQYPLWSVLRSGSVVVTGLCAFYAFSVLPLAQTYVLLFASPLFVTLLAIPMLGETVRLRRWLAIILGLVGILIVLRPGQSALSLGHLAALMSAVFGAFASIIVRKIGKEERNVVLLLYPMIANCIILGLALPFFYKPMPFLDLAGNAAIAALSVAAMSCMIAAYKRADAVLVAPMQYSQIIWAVLFGYLFFQETPDLWTFLGAIVVVVSGLYIVLREARPAVSEQTPVLRTRTRLEVGISPRVGIFLRKHQQ